MARFALISLAAALVAPLVSYAAPVPFYRGVELTVRANSTSTATAGEFQLQQYSAFQISDGEGGNAEAQANAVFVTPFSGQDLATVSSTSLANLQSMREAAESAETDDFDPQIDAASGSVAAELQVGKIKNKVLKLTGEIQGINIQIAQAKAAGKSTTSLESSLATETTKLNNNIKLDQANNGNASKGVA